MEAAAEVQVVLARRTSGESNFGDIGSRAAVGAAAHADRDRLLRKPVLLQDGFDLGQQVGQVPLGLGHGERAGRKGDAGDRVQSQCAGVVALIEPVLGKQGFDRQPVL